MSGYTVTITPAGDQSGPQTTIQVDTTRWRRTRHRTHGPRGRLRPFPAGASGYRLRRADRGAGSRFGTGNHRRSRDGAGRCPHAPTRSRRARKAAAEPAKKAARGRRRAAAGNAEAPRPAAPTAGCPTRTRLWPRGTRANSASALAAHFDVPRHTAQGWLRRLRTMGVIGTAS